VSRSLFNGLKVRCITLMLAGRNWCSRQDSHPHWRRSRRRVSAGWTTRAERNGASSRGCSGRNSLQKKSAGCCVEAREAEFRLAA